MGRQSSEDLRKLAEASRRHGEERPDNINHARECEAYWTRLAKLAEREGR